LSKRALTNPKGVAKELENPEAAKSTLFGLTEMGILAVDEAHEYRTGGTKFDGIIYLRDRALFVLALSATPLYTAARVWIYLSYIGTMLTSLGRICGILAELLTSLIFAHKRQKMRREQPLSSLEK
jgi:hypothetical protein